MGLGTLLLVMAYGMAGIVLAVLYVITWIMLCVACLR
jgi:hypothetical protein